MQSDSEWLAAHPVAIVAFSGPGRAATEPCAAALLLDGPVVDGPHLLGPGSLVEPFWAARLSGIPVVTAETVRTLAELQRLGVPSPEVWDVLDLCRVVHAERPGQNLEAVARAYGLVHPGAGVEAQVGLVSHLFRLVLSELRTAEPNQLGTAALLGSGLPSWPLWSLFQQLASETAAAHRLEHTEAQLPEEKLPWTLIAPTRRKGAGQRRKEPGEVTEASVLRHLSDGSVIQRLLPGFEVRTPQVELARSLTQTLNRGGQLVLEAGTGTGKSLGYLVPAAVAALQNDWRVVVSTATTNLQDQLYLKDLPIIRAVLGEELRASVLKGRANYLCLRRWLALLESPDLNDDERLLLLKTLFWVPRTASGDRAELQLSPGEESAWHRLSAVGEVCTPGGCAFHRVGVCFLARARRAAEESHVIVVNHALLLSDLASGNRVLPEYDVLIVDEAHHLEAEATNQLGWRATERELISRVDATWGATLGARGSDSAIRRAKALLRKGRDQPAARLPSASEAAPTRLRLVVRLLFARLGALLHGSGVAVDSGTLRLSAVVRRGPEWEEIEELCERANRELLESVAELTAVLGAVLEVPAEGAVRDLTGELQRHIDYWSRVSERLLGALIQPDTESVYWLAGTAGGVCLSAAPLDVSATLGEQLFSRVDTVAAVSATLAVDGSCGYVKKRIGLDEATELVLGSPFDYRRAALLYVPYDAPDPTQMGYQQVLHDTLLSTAKQLVGRTLVLFTSRAHLRTTYLGLKDALSAAGLSLVGQDVDHGSRTHLLDAFRAAERTVLFGTASFWEGIDVVGDALSCVVIVRLPFAVPTDPITAARSEQFDDPFSQYSVPQAVLRMKQGFGRLIRSSRDRGAVVVMDRRLVTRAYGSVILRSLPDCTVRQGPASRTARVVSDWLDRSHEEGCVPGRGIANGLQADTIEDQLRGSRRLAGQTQTRQ